MRTHQQLNNYGARSLEGLAHPKRDYSVEREAGQIVKFIAHQGAQGAYPPNSLPALEQAFGVADCVEFDVYVAMRDNGQPEIVVIHPEGYFLYVNHQGMQNEKPLPMTFEETRAHLVDGKPLIPTLDEVLDAYLRRCDETKKRSELHIELKGPGTAEVVLPILRERIKAATLSYDDFALTGLSYLGDRGRLVQARQLDEQVRLVFVARGGDYSQDGFAGLDDALAFAKSIRADTFTVARRGLPPADIEKIRREGFMVGTFHCRTSDEAEAASALSAEYVAADDFRGASIASYTGARLSGGPVYHELDQRGFFHTRDWIWEIGWEAEKSRDKAAVISASQLPTRLQSAGGLALAADGSSHLMVCDRGTPTGAALNFSHVPVSKKFVVGGTAEGAHDHYTWQSLLDERMLVESARDLLGALAKPGVVEDMLARSHSTRLDREAIIRFSEISPEQLNTSEQVVVEICRQVLTRYGRLVGALAFSALTPRHGDQTSYEVAIHAPHIESCFWARTAASEQIAAQGLRSGKACTASFI
jgi:glycerophosphoryl diester phosphodiesterase